MEKIIQNLENLGISGKEVDAYLALLKLRSATVIQLAKTTGLKRTTVYHCLEDLISKGLVSKVEKNDKKTYMAEDPKVALGNILNEKKESIDLVVPSLKEMFGIGVFQPEIRIYRNISGLRKIFEDLLKCEEKISRYYLSGTILEELMGEEFVETFVRKRIKAGITSLSLRAFEKYHPKWEKEGTHAQQHRKVKFLPEQYLVKPYMTIYDNKVVVISGQEKMGFIIESKEFADAQKIIFDMLWDTVAI
jgi:sugar-specific transcriptional regulator TrmB